MNPWSQYLDKREKNILPHYLFQDKNHSKLSQIDATNYYVNDLLLRQETQKKIACSESWYNNN